MPISTLHSNIHSVDLPDFWQDGGKGMWVLGDVECVGSRGELNHQILKKVELDKISIFQGGY